MRPSVPPTLARYRPSPMALTYSRGLVPALEVQDLFSRLQPLLPSLLLEPEVQFVRGSKVSSSYTVANQHFCARSGSRELNGKLWLACFRGVCCTLRLCRRLQGLTKHSLRPVFCRCYHSILLAPRKNAHTNKCFSLFFTNCNSPVQLESTLKLTPRSLRLSLVMIASHSESGPIFVSVHEP